MNKEMLLRALMSKKALVTISFIVGAIAGGGGTFLALHKTIEKKYLDISDEEIDKAKLFYKKLYKQDEFSSPETLTDTLTESSTFVDGVSAAISAIKNYNGIGIENAAPSSVWTKSNIFENDTPEDTFDYDEEIAKRDGTRPYVISCDEFMENDDENEQLQLTYFEGDSVLCDDEDHIIPEMDEVVGIENLNKFGHGSGDKNVVFVRNDALRSDYEIARSGGRFAVEVLGYPEPETKRTIRKFRGDDE